MLYVKIYIFIEVEFFLVTSNIMTMKNNSCSKQENIYS